MNKKYAAIAIGVILLISLISAFVVSRLITPRTTEENQTIITPTPTVTLPFTATTTPDIVAANFYTYYQNCTRAGINPSTTMTLSQFCQTATKLTSSGYDEKIKAQTPNPSGIDPVFCEKAPPPDVNKDLVLSTPNIQDDTASVSITGNYPNKRIIIQFTFQKNTLHEWKIANIVCH